MYGRRLFNSSKGVGSKTLASTDWQKSVQHHVVVAKHFKQRFINEYLTALQERHYYQNKTKSIKNNIKIEDVHGFEGVIKLSIKCQVPPCKFFPLSQTF